ncbi:MAG: hypothetical protein DHS20C13_02770 [Thermodesulfobacteriota bacterium]|nr:MAG: hypothetical protein DHS20C13_02770 [Thermodesulfobacteriota bacterium]
MRPFCLFVSLWLAIVPLAHSNICAYGFHAGNSDTIKIHNMMSDFADAKPNIIILFSNEENVTTNASQIEALLDLQNAYGGKGIISLADIAFNRVAPGLADCSNYGGGSVTGAQTWQLRSDYQSRLTTFFNNSSKFADFSKVFAISVHEEVNNDCVKQSEIESVTNYIKNTLNITTVPLAVGYGDSEWPLGGFDGKDLPISFPANTDVIGIWDYGMFNPTDQSDSLNGSSNWDSRWAAIKAKLGTRKAVFAINSWCISSHESAGWTPDCYIQEPSVIRDYFRVTPTYYWTLWALQQPEVIALIGFEYDFVSGRYVKDMPLHQTWIKNLIKAQNCTYTFP